jgi:hypothetical protein
VEAKPVEEVFVREAFIWEIDIGGKTIRTTAEHPLYREGDGWTAVNLLRIGDRVKCESDIYSTISAIRDSNDRITVYNCRVADDHTYFVGENNDGTAVWAHNARYRSNFFNQWPLFKGLVVVHHRIEQQVLKLYPGLFTRRELDAVHNLRGIPNGINRDFHLGELRRIWNTFYKRHPNANKDDFKRFADIIDRFFSNRFIM